MNAAEIHRRESTIIVSKAVRHIVGARRLAQLMQRQDKSGFLFSSFHFGVLTCTVYLLQTTFDSIWYYPILMLHGFIIVRLFALYHEASHGTVFKTRWMNITLIGQIKTLIFNTRTRTESSIN